MLKLNNYRTAIFPNHLKRKLRLLYLNNEEKMQQKNLKH